MTPEPMLAQSAVFLVSFWKPLLMVPPFLAWAWLISTKLDKDAKRYHLNFMLWNSLHVAAGVAALIVMLVVPIFFVGWVAGMILLAAPILAYWHIRNQAVPEWQKFSLSGAGIAESLEARRKRRATREALIRFADGRGKDVPVPLKDDPLLPIHVLAEDLLGPAVASRASRLELIVGPSGTTILQTIDGIKYKRQPLPTESGTALIDFFKSIAKLDVQDRRRRQSGLFHMSSTGAPIAISLATEGSSTGLRALLEFDRARRILKPFDGLGLLPSQLEGLRTLEVAHERHGIVLLGAPPGQGLSTSGYSFLNRHDAYTSNIKTLEREILTEIDGVDQVQWDPNNPAVDYATNLQSILRRDPDIVMTGEIPDGETARVASQPGMTGPLIYVPQRAESIAEQVSTWVGRVGDIKQATRGLRAVVNQRLLRSLCPNCRQAYQPTAEQLKKLNLPAGKVKQLYRKTGKVQVKNKIEDCPVCGGTGYLGQTAAFEVFIVDDEARKLIGAKDLKGALAHARRNKMILLAEAALSKAIAGETSLEEVVRITTSQAQAKPPRESTPKSQPDPAATPT